MNSIVVAGRVQSASIRTPNTGNRRVPATVVLCPRTNQTSVRTACQKRGSLHATRSSHNGSHATADADPASLVSQFYDLAQKGSSPDASLITTLGESLQTKHSSFGPQELANLLWSIAKTGTKVDPKILAAITGLISAKAGSFKPAQIGAVLWALGTIGKNVDPGVVGALANAIKNQVTKFDPSSLTDALWGLAKLGGKLDGGTIGKLAQAVKSQASKFRPQEAANALWALIKLDQDNGGTALKAIAAIGAGTVAMKSIKGLMGGGGGESEEDESAAAESAKKQGGKSQSDEERIQAALDALTKSGADPKTIRAMAEAAKGSSSSNGSHSDGNHVVDALATLRQMGHAPEEQHHSSGLGGALKRAVGL